MILVKSEGCIKHVCFGWILYNSQLFPTLCHTGTRPSSTSSVALLLMHLKQNLPALPGTFCASRHHSYFGFVYLSSVSRGMAIWFSGGNDCKYLVALSRSLVACPGPLMVCLSCRIFPATVYDYRFLSLTLTSPQSSLDFVLFQLIQKVTWGIILVYKTVGSSQLHHRANKSI